MQTYFDILSAYPDQAALMRHLEARLAWYADQSNQDKWFEMEETFKDIDPTEKQMYIIGDVCDESYATVSQFLADIKTLTVR